MTKFNRGNIIKCKVTGIEKYGVFVSVENGYNGLIHISEISDSFVRDINDYVTIGEEIYAIVLESLDNFKQLKLSVKEIDYRHSGEKKKKLDTHNGFKPLKEQLNKWTEEKMVEYSK